MPVPPVIQMYRYVMGSGGGLGNLLKASEEFQQTVDWVRYPTSSQTPTVNADSRPDPNGGTTADQVGFTANTSARLQQTVTLSASTEYTFSVHARAVSGTVDFRMRNVTLKDSEVKTATTTGPDGGGFTRFTYTFTTGAAGSYELALQNDTNATAKDVIFWGAMLNEGGTALDYQYAAPTTGGSAPAPAYAGFGDSFGGVTAYYSLRQFTEAETLNAIRVRRSSDDTEQDIGFDANGDLDTTALTTFVNAEHTLADEDFSSAIGWNLGTGLTITGGVLRANTSGGGITAYKNFGDPGAQQVRVTFTISNYVSGSVRYMNFGTPTLGTSRSANGTYTEVLTLQEGGNFNHGLQFNSSFVGDIDDFEIVQITADGAVTTFYDQSGNGNNATNATSTEQPLVVSGGTLVTLDGYPCLDGDLGAGDTMLQALDVVDSVGDVAIFSTYALKTDGTTANQITFEIGNGTSTARIHDTMGRGGAGTFGIDIRGTTNYDFGNATGVAVDDIYLNSILSEANGFYINGTQQTSDNAVRSGSIVDALTLFNRGSGSFPFKGKYFEFIFFASDQSSNRGTVTTGGGTGIEGNINTYFNIV